MSQASEALYLTHRPEVTWIPLELIRHPKKGEPYFTRDVDPKIAEFEELVVYAKRHREFLNPIKVIKRGDWYVVIAGNHRLAAYHEANRRGAKIETVTVEVWPVDDTTALKIALIDNISRRAMTKIEERLSWASIAARPEFRGLPLGEVAYRMGVPAATLRNAKFLDKLSPPAFSSVCKTETIPLSVGYALGTLPPGEQQDWLDFCRKKDVPARAKIKAIADRRDDVKAGSPPGGGAASEIIQTVIDNNVKLATFHGKVKMRALYNRIAKGEIPMNARAQAAAVSLLRVLLGHTAELGPAFDRIEGEENETNLLGSKKV